MIIKEVINTLLNSILSVSRCRIKILKALVIPFIATSGLVFMHPGDPVGWQYVLIFVLVQWIIFVMLVVSIHRIILLGPDSVPDWGLYLPGGRELEFFLFSILLGIILIPLGLFILIPGLGVIITILLAPYFIGRLSLAFPSIATDDDLRFSESWTSTKNHQILMYVVVAIYPLLISIPDFFIALIPNETVLLLLSNVFSLIAMVFIIAALSESYRFIEGQYLEKNSNNM